MIQKPAQCTIQTLPSNLLLRKFSVNIHINCLFKEICSPRNKVENLVLYGPNVNVNNVDICEEDICDEVLNMIFQRNTLKT